LVLLLLFTFVKVKAFCDAYMWIQSDRSLPQAKSGTINRLKSIRNRMDHKSIRFFTGTPEQKHAAGMIQAAAGQNPYRPDLEK
jgi:hypothetical protein